MALKKNKETIVVHFIMIKIGICVLFMLALVMVSDLKMANPSFPLGSIFVFL